MAELKLRNPFENPPGPDNPPASRKPMTPKLVPPGADDRLAAQPPFGTSADDTEAPQPTVRLSVDLERSLHRRLRQWALQRDQTASDVIRELLTSALDGAGY
jgi:hypothetical protein